MQYTQNEINITPLSWLPGIAVEQFGAVGDGVTDDAAAINLAADRALEEGHGVVLFSGRDYLVGSKIIHKRGIVWQGQGRTKTRILGDELDGPIWGAPDPSYSVLINDRVIGGSIIGIQFDNLNSAAVGGIGIDLSQISYVFLNDVQVNRCETGIRINNISYGNKISDFGASGCVDGVQIQNGSREISLTHGRINSVTNGILVAQGADAGVNGLNLNDVTIEGYTNNATQFDCVDPEAVDSVMMTRMRYENGGAGTAIVVNGPVGLVDDQDHHITGTTYLGGTHPARVSYRNLDLGRSFRGPREFTAYATTVSDATEILFSVAVGEGEAYFVDAKVSGKNADGSVVYMERISFTNYRQGAGAPAFGNVIQDSTATARVNGGTTNGVTASNSVNVLNLSCTGEVGENMNWTAQITVTPFDNADQFV